MARTSRTAIYELQSVLLAALPVQWWTPCPVRLDPSPSRGKREWLTHFYTWQLVSLAWAMSSAMVQAEHVTCMCLPLNPAGHLAWPNSGHSFTPRHALSNHTGCILLVVVAGGKIKQTTWKHFTCQSESTQPLLGKYPLATFQKRCSCFHFLWLFSWKPHARILSCG